MHPPLSRASSARRSPRSRLNSAAWGSTAAVTVPPLDEQTDLPVGSTWGFTVGSVGSPVGADGVCARNDGVSRRGRRGSAPEMTGFAPSATSSNPVIGDGVWPSSGASSSSERPARMTYRFVSPLPPPGWAISNSPESTSRASNFSVWRRESRTRCAVSSTPGQHTPSSFARSASTTSTRRADRRASERARTACTIRQLTAVRPIA